MPEPRLLTLDPNLLVPNAWNTNIVPPGNEAKLEESIKRNGLFKPVIVREVGEVLEIIGGEHRWGIAKRIGLKTVPVVNMGPIDDKRAKEISVIDNTRYGADETMPFAELLKSIGDNDEIQSFLPFADEELTSIFSSLDIALDDLELDGNFESDADQDVEPPAAKAPKTHQLMRFKVPTRDAERITAVVAKTQKIQGFTGSDELTNAGDALVHLLVGQFIPETAESFRLEELNDVLNEIDGVVP